MRRFVIGTAGHVDHGKTTLVRALTGIDTDRLPEEKRRGITIELGFAPWKLDDETMVSIIDVPGHKRLVHTMIAGASGIELVVVVVSADEGVMPQTREHVAVCEVLGIERAVVAVTKTDRVDADLATMAGEEASELLSDRFVHEVVHVSAKSGAGLDLLRDAVARALRSIDPPAASKRSYLSIDRAFSVKGTGAVVTGTLVKGSISVGEELFVVGRNGAKATSARGLHVHDRGVDRAEAPARLAVNLGGLSLDELERGGVLTSDSDVSPTACFDASLDLGRATRSGATVDVYVGTARTAGRLQIFKSLEPAVEGAADGVDENGPTRPRVFGRLRLDAPLVVVGGDRFVLRTSAPKGPSGAVLGGGTVLDARPPRLRKRALRLASLAALDAGDASLAARALVVEAAPRPLNKSELGARLAIDAALLVRAAEKLGDRGDLVRTKGDGYVDRAALPPLAAWARELTSEHHRVHPLERGIRLETLRQRLSLRCGPAVADEAIRWAARSTGIGEPLVVEGDIARLASFLEGASEESSAPVVKAGLALHEAGLKGLGEFALTELLALSPKEVRAVLAKLARDGVALTAGGQWFEKRGVDALRERVRAHFGAAPVLTIAAFKELSGLGRKQAIPLLELFDREGVTMRKGDERAPGPASARIES